MSKIIEMRKQIEQLTQQLQTVEINYLAAKQMYDLLSQYENAAALPDELLDQLVITAELGGRVVLVPPPPPAAMLDQLAAAAEAYAKDISRIWGEMQQTTTDAVQHLNTAASQAQQEQQGS